MWTKFYVFVKESSEVIKVEEGQWVTQRMDILQASVGPKPKESNHWCNLEWFWRPCNVSWRKQGYSCFSLDWINCWWECYSDPMPRGKFLFCDHSVNVSLPYEKIKERTLKWFWLYFILIIVTQLINVGKRNDLKLENIKGPRVIMMLKERT